MNGKCVLCEAERGNSQHKHPVVSICESAELHNADGLSVELLNNARDIKPRAH